MVEKDEADDLLALLNDTLTTSRTVMNPAPQNDISDYKAALSPLNDADELPVNYTKDMTVKHPENKTDDLLDMLDMLQSPSPPKQIPPLTSVLTKDEGKVTQENETDQLLALLSEI